jgi:hypothetical protein
MVIKILIGISPERVAVVVTAVGLRLQVEIKIDHGLFVVSANMFETPEQKGVRVEGVERADGCLEIGKYCDREYNRDDHIGSTEYLP